MKKDLPIPRSAPVRETLTAASRIGGNKITIERLGPLRRRGRPIEWIRMTLIRADGTRERWAQQYTGANLTRLSAEFDEMERDFRADRRITDVTRF